MSILARMTWAPLVLLLCIQTACKPDHKPAAQNDAAANNSPSDAAEDIGKSDLLELIQGKWFDAKDANKSLEVIGNELIWHMPNQQDVQATVDIDSNCTLQSCQQTLPQQGWCFVAHFEAGQQCFLVLSCDKSSFRFARLDATLEEEVYQRP
ncbi:MAG: hypothetical protein IPL65_03645 [Lewinellaceae bacterium]|nr:hypothetical protein [Lewinellaceae bacterium]